MVRHIVMYNLADSDARPKTERVAEIRAKAREVGLPGLPGVLRFEVLENYKEGGHDLFIDSDMESPAAEAAYQTHPAHQEFKAFLAGKVCDRAVADAVVE